MKSFACFVLIAQAVLLQTAYSYVISAPYGPSFFGSPIIGPSIAAPAIAAPVIRAPGPVYSSVVQPNSVANSLADTLSLLTVSSLLAETLPLPQSVLPVSLPLGCGCGGCGCGCGYPNTILI